MRAAEVEAMVEEGVDTGAVDVMVSWWGLLDDGGMSEESSSRVASTRSTSYSLSPSTLISIGL